MLFLIKTRSVGIYLCVIGWAQKKGCKRSCTELLTLIHWLSREVVLTVTSHWNHLDNFKKYRDFIRWECGMGIRILKSSICESNVLRTIGLRGSIWMKWLKCFYEFKYMYWQLSEAFCSPKCVWLCLVTWAEKKQLGLKIHYRSRKVDEQKLYVYTKHLCMLHSCTHIHIYVCVFDIWWWIPMRRLRDYSGNQYV